MGDKKLLSRRSAARTSCAALVAVLVLAAMAQLQVSVRYHRHLPRMDEWARIPAYIVSDDKLLFRSLRASFSRRDQPPEDVRAFAPVTSPPPAAFIADVGIGWENMGKGRWTWRGTFVGSYPPPTKPTAAQGSWVPRARGWTPDPRDSRKWTFEGSFEGPTPPSPPGPQSGSFGGFAGKWVIDKKSLAGKTWTWHGSWTGRVPIP